MARSDFEIVQTPNGAHAMRDLRNGEVMHPGTGAGVEPDALYVGPSRLAVRLAEDSAEPLVLLDVGLGAASNAIAAWKVSERMPESARRLEIVSFENDLGALELALANAQAFGLEGEAYGAADMLLRAGTYETQRTRWRLSSGDFVQSIAHEQSASADIVFWDFYSPKSQPSLWNVSTLKSLRRVCRAGATLHTYSTATSLRAGLLLAGFAVGVGGGTGKRSESTIAATDIGSLDTPLGARWLERLERSHAPFPNDVPDATCALATIRRAPQFSK